MAEAMAATYRCESCGREFSNGKSWGGHIRACYKKKNKEEDTEVASDFSGSESEIGEKEVHGDDYVESAIDLRKSLPQSWCRGSRKRSTPDDMLRLAAIKLLSVSEENEEKLQEYQNNSSFAHHLKVDKKPMKVSASVHERKHSQDRGHRSYVCRECGLVFDNFQGLGGHLAAHNRRRLREREAEESVSVDGDRRDSKGKNSMVATSPAAAPRKEYPCNVCGKIFPSGQALGGHKSYHSSAHVGSNSSSKKTSSDGEVSHPDPPPPEGLLDLNTAPDEGIWGTDSNAGREHSLPS